MQSRFNKRQIAELEAEGFQIGSTKSYALRKWKVSGGVANQAITRTNRGWRWFCQSPNYGPVMAECNGLHSPDAALTHAKVENWGLDGQ